MAESALVAFGRYVRMHRERKGLSLDEAVGLTRVYPNPLNKGYLSRVENGAVRIGFDKMIAVARAYDVPVDVFAERMWLDLELEKNDPPDTEGMSFGELLEQGGVALRRGYRWRAYALGRDAIHKSRNAALRPNFGSHEEQLAVATMNCATAAQKLGALRFALHEYEFLDRADSLGLSTAPALLTCMATTHRALGDNATAIDMAERAIEAASVKGADKFLGYCYAIRALAAYGAGRYDESIQFEQKALDEYRRVGRLEECAGTHLNLAQLFFDTKRLGAAKRSITAARKIADQHAVDSVHCRADILAGEIALLEKKPSDATRLWQRAADKARSLRDRTLVFKAEYQLLRHAVHESRHEYARSLARRLNRIAPWITPNTPELRDFATLLDSMPPLVRKRKPVVK